MAILKLISYLAGGVEGSFGGKILLAGWVSSDPEQWRQAGDVRSKEPEAEVASVQLEVQAVGGGHDGIQELLRAQGRRGK